MRKLIRFILIVICGGALLAGGVVAFAVPLAAVRTKGGVASLPYLAPLADIPSEQSVVYADDGKTVLGYFRDSVNRIPVALSAISPNVVHAVLDTEDARYYIHGAIDYPSTLRAFISNYSASRLAQGGSDITQQLVKNTYTGNSRKLSRKIKEAIIAVRLQRQYTKDQILDAYLNTVYFGNGAYGVEAAANEYFNLPAKALSQPEAALLAGLIQSPSGYNPITHPVASRVRRNFVLGRMLKQKHLSPAEELLATEAPLPTSITYPQGVSDTKFGYYTLEVRHELLGNPSTASTVLPGNYEQRKNELFNGGYTIYTNLDPNMQLVAERTVATDTPNNNRGFTASMVVIDTPTGRVRAVVGGPGTDQSQFDIATQSVRNPGSGFKLFTLLAAYQAGYSPNSQVDGTSPCGIRFPGNDHYYSYQTPLHNAADGEGKGLMSITDATAYSINCAYMRMAHEVGLPAVIQMAHQLGISETLSPTNPSLVIGGTSVKVVEMANAYATVADGGIYHTPAFINHIVDRNGKTFYTNTDPGQRVLSPQLAAEAVQTLKSVVAYGTGTAAAVSGHEVAGKTGTTDNFTDAWFNGITRQLSASVWMGAVSGEVPMTYVGRYYEVFGGDYPTEIWHDFMNTILTGVPNGTFPVPDPSQIPPAKPVDSYGLQRDSLFFTPPTTVPPPTTAPPYQAPTTQTPQTTPTAAPTTTPTATPPTTVPGVPTT